MYKIFLLFISLWICNDTLAQDSLSVLLDQQTPPGAYRFTESFIDKNGLESSMPITVFKGKSPGPTITFIAGIHGYEYPPIIACQEIIHELNVDTVKGTIIVIPMANPNAFYGRTPFTNPQDRLNLNRVFPGDQNGSITEIVAAYITDVVISQTDIFVDIHGGDANEDLLPFICYYDNESKKQQTALAKKLSMASGFEFVVSYKYKLLDTQPAKYAFKQAVQDGKTALSIEAGKLGNVQKDALLLIKNGMYNILAELQMYSPSNGTRPKITSINNQSYIRSEHQGIFESSLRSSEHVTANQVIGLIRNTFGDYITEIKAPISGIILYKIGTPPVNVGETIMCIGSLE